VDEVSELAAGFSARSSLKPFRFAYVHSNGRTRRRTHVPHGLPSRGQAIFLTRHGSQLTGRRLRLFVGIAWDESKDCGRTGSSAELAIYRPRCENGQPRAFLAATSTAGRSSGDSILQVASPSVMHFSGQKIGSEV
jgi:hypothetical protein